MTLGREGVAVFRTFSNQSMAPEWPLHTGDPARIPAVGDVDGRNLGLKMLPVMDRWLWAYKADGDAHERQLSGATEVQ